MPTFIELTPDPFTSTSDIKANTELLSKNKIVKGRNETFNNVRRPVRGLQVKADTYAMIQVISSDGTSKFLIDSGGPIEDKGIGRTVRFSNFLLQSVQEARQEKMQIVETFGEPYIFFYGEHPRIIQMSGILLNSEDFNWKAEWWANYEEFLRGTKCVDTKTRVIMSWDDVVVTGYMIQCSSVDDASQVLSVNFNFSLLLTHYQNISGIGKTEFPSGAAEINLDPNTLDVEGFSKNFASSTLAVRNANSSSNVSLLGRLRAGISDFLTNADSWQTGIINSVGDLLMGRQVVVPMGFEASSVFDETQIAQGSAEASVLFGTGLQAKLAGQTIKIKASRLNPTFQNSNIKRGPISLNLDEYIGRVTSSSASPSEPINLYKDQLAREGKEADKVKEVYDKFGINTEPKSGILPLALHAAFGVVQVAGGAALWSKGKDNPLDTSNNVKKPEKKDSGALDYGSYINGL